MKTNGGSEPDHSPERIIVDRIVDVTSDGTTPNTNHPDNSKTMEILQIQFLDRVVDRWRATVATRTRGVSMSTQITVATIHF